MQNRDYVARMSPTPRVPWTWPFALAGAALVFACVVAAYAGGEEAGNPIVILGTFGAVVGALVGTWLGGLFNGRRPQR